ncbi:Enamine deaminase RidA, house cleaning of reactive enamine intermediates, YjgF/YER057c/UK114 family [Devosia enhydra]|uniref:Enamine deaminase RidA, house cleaning of reactive enamine intermediates, YjgF/YER057c/UK114 family n=1 Tax=Devosia enhydra TaxID=665118 RepID=A0A1K2HZV0_9HYPH|nr:RidA family protein [Devosia enhydra]SFZ85551.1 Enamine deaminase RidA, house cleaning of reactive enamine intermediates, YjgF/YER057c/UK114 family [Devosia enhydra]
MSIEARIAELGLALLQASEPKGNYIPFKRTGNLLYISGQLPLGPDGKVPERWTGKIGSKVTEAEGNAAARACLLTILSQARLALGSLDRLHACVRLGGFVNAEPDYTTPGAVVNGASDAIVDIMGEAGRHSRTTIGVATLPLEACVEVEAVFEISERPEHM